MIRPDAFQESFSAWVSGLNFGSDGLNVIAIDGKSLRRSHDKKSFKSKLHSVAAWSVENRVVLGCQSVDQKSNEITAIPALLKKLGLTGATITTDAMGSEKDIATQFVSDYNDRRLHSAIGYITPSDMLAGKQKAIHEERDRELEEAREDRRKIRAQQATARYANKPRLEDRAMLGSNLSAESMPKASAMGVEAESLPPGTCHLPLATMR